MALWLCTLLSCALAAATSGVAESNGECEEASLLQIPHLRGEQGSALEMGTAIVPMDVLHWKAGFLSFGINVTPSWPEVQSRVYGLAPQRLLLDLGSSTIGYCDTVVAYQAFETTNWKTCLSYGAYPAFFVWWGSIYQGGLNFTSASGNASINGTFGTMTFHRGMPCKGGMQGIIGAAFDRVNFAYEQMSPLHFFEKGNCPERGPTLPATFVSSVRQLYGNHFGISWTGERGFGTASLFLGAAATDNNPAQSAGKTRILPGGAYFVNMTKYSFNGIEVEQFCGGQQPCSIDSGAPTMGFPQEILDAIKKQPNGTVSLELEGAGSDGPVVLDFDVATLIARDWLDFSSQSGVLTFPTFAFYSLLFDVNEEAPTVEFTKYPIPPRAVPDTPETRMGAGEKSRWPRVNTI